MNNNINNNDDYNGADYVTNDARQDVTNRKKSAADVTSDVANVVKKVKKVAKSDGIKNKSS